MPITPSALSTLNTNFKGTVQEAFRGATPMFSEVATEIPSNTKSNTYGFVDQFPGMKEWLGERTLEELEAKSLLVTNKHYEDSIQIDEDDYDDDELGLWSKQAEWLAQTAAYYPDVLVMNEVKKSFTENSYDGKTFFATDHSWKGDTYSNKLTLDLDDANFEEAFQLLVSNVGGSETPLIGPVFNVTLMCGPKLRATALRILESDFTSLMVSNVNKGSAKMFLHPQITNNDWMLAITSLPVKPWLFQRRSALRTMTPQDFPEERSKRKRFIWGVDYRCRAGKLLWQLAVGCKGS